MTTLLYLLERSNL